MKKKYNYQITLKSLDPEEEGREQEKAIRFNVQNHDNVFAVIRRSRKRLHFDDATTTSFAVGLKLITEVLLENRNDPLFSELKPAMVSFMKKLKTQLKPPLQPQFSSKEVKENNIGKTLGIKESVERSIQEIEQKSIAFSEIEVSSIEEMDDDLMAEFENSSTSASFSEIEDDDERIVINSQRDENEPYTSTISDDFSLSSQLEDTQYTLVEKVGQNGVLEEIELLEVDDDKISD